MNQALGALLISCTLILKMFTVTPESIGMSDRRS